MKRKIDSNLRSLVSEATALPTLPLLDNYFFNAIFALNCIEQMKMKKSPRTPHFIKRNNIFCAFLNFQATIAVTDYVIAFFSFFTVCGGGLVSNYLPTFTVTALSQNRIARNQSPKWMFRQT